MRERGCFVGESVYPAGWCLFVGLELWTLQGDTVEVPVACYSAICWHIRELPVVAVCTLVPVATGGTYRH